MTDVKVLLLHSNTWNHLTMRKQFINIVNWIIPRLKKEKMFIYLKKKM